ncbi:myb-like protein O isoform X2 [Schistocerca gregaria]|uniref:myb-like protein O isoform X2 n=1 Tax=Schistocerca gregaria TaxID=7010 RepID=UPI00211EDC19|nr:myb-like protein O isoform X2 [Schistocerca gregaria]
MANKLSGDVKDTSDLQKEMCMSSLKRALDDVEYNSCGAEPLRKKTRLPVLKRHIRSSTNGKKAKVGARTHCRLQNNKKHFQKAPPNHSSNGLSCTATSQGSNNEHKTDESSDLAIKKKRAKRSADSDSLPNHTTEESDIKKRKVDQTATETESENCQDSAKPSNEQNTSEATCSTSQRTESPKLVARLCGIADYMRVQQNYTFRKNVAFARKIFVYSSDGSEYDYDNNGTGDNDDDDGDLYDDDDGDLYDDDDDDDDVDNDDDDDDDYEDVDPDAEVVSKRLNLQIADFFKLHRNREPSALNASKPQSGEVRATEQRQTTTFGIGLFYDPTLPGGSGAAAAAAAAAAAVAAGFEHDENGNDAEEFDRASAASNNLKHGVPW